MKEKEMDRHFQARTLGSTGRKRDQVEMLKRSFSGTAKLVNALLPDGHEKDHCIADLRKAYLASKEVITNS